MQKGEENESFSHPDAPKFSDPGDEEKTSHHMPNSNELSGHDDASIMISKVKHQVSEIFPQPHENEEELRR